MTRRTKLVAALLAALALTGLSACSNTAGQKEREPLPVSAANQAENNAGRETETKAGVPAAPQPGGATQH